MLTEWRDRQITDISRADIRQCIDSIMQRGAVAMAARAFRVIRAMFNWCVGRGLIETSACVGLVPPPIGRPRDRVLTDDELAVVLGSTMAIPGHYGPIVMMLALTG
jgi:site-specific recombinase XerD